MTRHPLSPACVPTTEVPAVAVRRIVELASRAPSFQNTQPWRWVARQGGLELYADRSRRLPLTDPAGRNLVISCGAALDHARRAAGALGLSAAVDRLPSRGVPDLLARLDLRAAGGACDPGVIETIERRRTDRRRFSGWPVADAHLTELAGRAEERGVIAVPVSAADRYRAETLINLATELQGRDRGVLRELAAWLDHGASDGIPHAVLPSAQELSSRRPNRFTAGVAQDPTGSEPALPDGLLVLGGHADDELAWLRVGEALSAVGLAATGLGLAVVPLSQVVEVPATRAALEHELMLDGCRAQLAVRVGRLPSTLGELPMTPRRPVGEVLELG